MDILSLVQGTIEAKIFLASIIVLVILSVHDSMISRSRRTFFEH